MMIHAAYASDDGYCQHLAASVYSLLEQNMNEEITIHILSDHLKKENRERLENMVQKMGKCICFYSVDDLESRLSNQVGRFSTGKFRITTMARLLLGSLLPIEVERVLYLDADTIVCGQIRSLYESGLEDKLAAMAPEPTIYRAVREKVGLDEQELYCNAGVLLLDLGKWREAQMENACLGYYREMEGMLPFNDQDILNHVLRGRLRVVSQKYNFFSNYYYFRYQTLCTLCPEYASIMSEEEYQSARETPIIVHFAGDERPWIYGNRNVFRSRYEDAVKKTQFPMQRIRGKWGYMQLYHFMNMITYYFPEVRRWISGLYYREKVEKRGKD